MQSKGLANRAPRMDPEDFMLPLNLGKTHPVFICKVTEGLFFHLDRDRQIHYKPWLRDTLGTHFDNGNTGYSWDFVDPNNFRLEVPDNMKRRWDTTFTDGNGNLVFGTAEIQFEKTTEDLVRQKANCLDRLVRNDFQMACLKNMIIKLMRKYMSIRLYCLCSLSRYVQETKSWKMCPPDFDGIYIEVIDHYSLLKYQAMRNGICIDRVNNGSWSKDNMIYPWMNVGVSVPEPEPFYDHDEPASLEPAEPLEPAGIFAFPPPVEPPTVTELNRETSYQEEAEERYENPEDMPRTPGPEEILLSDDAFVLDWLNSTVLGPEQFSE